ncbi:hypothetical protein DIPPA_12238 [Diplonema papillatum]|nr:hypothetical protein DIPPA_12238 [Diplonema papillatum]
MASLAELGSALAHGLSLSIGGVDVKEVLVTLVAEARASKGRIEALEKDAVARASKAAARSTRPARSKPPDPQ